ncbi:MAG: YihY family inner membrane protein [Oligoflexia bacterium]|nr:YihY family inner membrane protein [Oligoflexia bacterium]
MKDLKEFWKKSQNDLIFTQSTALAYTTLVSLVPLCAVAFFLFKSFGGFENLQSALEPLMQQNLAPAFGDKITNYINAAVSKVHAGAVGTVGLIGFIITTVLTISTIEKSFNIIWGVKKPRSLSKRITTYWTLLSIGPVLITLSVVFGSRAFFWLENDNGVIANILVILLKFIPYLASGLLFSAVFFFIPNTQVNYKDAIKAGIITGVVFELAKLLYARYAVQAISNDALYGSLVVIPVFLVWLYVVWLILLFGAELCCYFQFKRLKIKYKFNWQERLTPFAIVDILELLVGASKAKSKQVGLKIDELMAQLQMPFHELISHLDFLVNEGLVAQSQKKYFLTIAESEINLSEIFEALDAHRYSPKGALSLSVHQKMRQLWKSI